MNSSPATKESSLFLFLSLSMITCLILLINLSFKIIHLRGLEFAASSLLCPIISCLFLFTLRHCSFKEQRHLLNISLMTLYLFCIGIYVLVNLPAAQEMNNSAVYHIIFEDIPKKFFATTIAFALSFYLPHLLLCTRTYTVLNSSRHCVLFALFGGIAFFLIDFLLLFSAPHLYSFKQIFIDSSLISALLYLLMGVIYLAFILGDKQRESSSCTLRQEFPLYQYLLCFAVTVMLISLACEYRIVALNKHGFITASSLFFPITLMISTLIGEKWGYKANLKLTLILMVTQLIFDALLMAIVALPSPAFYNLTPFYQSIMPRRLPAALLALFVTFMSNAMLLHYLKNSTWNLHRALRIFIANCVANSLLCLVNYSVLFAGIYPYEQIINLVINVWDYKVLVTIISLPMLLWICRVLEKKTIIRSVGWVATQQNLIQSENRSPY